ncbi:MAG: long-chain fatty acid--CoA ligase [Candidatus Omnitrophica bacterium]|nr:long-chain fatty acid--CoA ligase [Candidatus Omnitrophota bacterium]
MKPGKVTDQNLAMTFLSQAARLNRKCALLHKGAISGQFEEITWAEWQQSVITTAGALKAAGARAGDKIAIMAENRPEWTYVDLAALGLGAVVVPVYPTLALPEVLYVLRHSEAKILFISNPAMAEQIHAQAAGELTHLKTIILFKKSETSEGQTLQTWDAFIQQGASFRFSAEDFRQCAGKVLPEDTATIIYTSGTTGPQKGVMLTHRNFMENARMASAYIHVGEADVALSFLPLSHVFERLAGYYFMIQAGASIAYAESIQTVPEDIKLIRPTVAAAVPRFYEKVHAKIMEQVRSKGPLAQKLFSWSLKIGRRYEDARRLGTVPFRVKVFYFFADFVALGKIKKAMGGRIRYFISGGAPLNRVLAEFFYSAGVLILEGYGLTETSPVIAVNSDSDFEFGTVGRPLPGIEVKIAPDGEILTRSACVMKGYYRDDAATAKVMQEGWFLTGDIGQIDAKGFLRITDRKKDIIVTSGGKNIAPQNLESELMEDPLIQQAVIIGDKRNYLVALIVPVKSEILKRCAAQGIKDEAWPQLLKNSEVHAWVARVVDEKMSTKASYERIKYFALLDRELTLESGELTPTLKVKRRVVMQNYAGVIDELYRQGDLHQAALLRKD